MNRWWKKSTTMTERDEKGRFVTQGPSEGFDEEEGKGAAEEHSWSNKREENLKRLGLWKEIEE